MATPRPFSRVSLAAVAASAMAVATFALIAFGVLASELIAEFGVERWQVGLLVTATGAVGALVSPLFGRLTDRLGGRRSTTGVLMAGVVAMTLVSTAPSYALLIAGALINGIPQGWANPATNALIVDNLTAGARGVLTGVKQSGVQMGAFLGGLLLPALAEALGWRAAFALFLTIPLAGLIGIRGRADKTHAPRTSARARHPVPTVVKWITAYGALSGLGVSATTTFLPLFAEEDQGWTNHRAGLLIAAVGLIGVIARIAWGTASERRLGHGRTLTLLASQSSVAVLLLFLASVGVLPGWVLAVSAVLFGAGATAWNAVGMLAVMDYSRPELVGRGTGMVMFGFLTGMATGAPLMGLSVDRLGTYRPGWITVAVLFALAAVVAGSVRRTGTLASA